MNNRITRRDFLNGAQIAIGAGLAAPLLAACQAGDAPYPFALGGGYYPPSKTGLRGSHDGAWETMHARVSGAEWPASPVEENYDLVVVGAGISGLAAANFYREAKPDARILILDNHDDFGGHAKRNEFDFNGETRITYGGTEAIDTPSHYAPESLALLERIGVELKRFYDYYDEDLYAPYKLSKSIVFDAAQFGQTKFVGGYGARPWAAFATDAPLSDKARADFIRVHTENVDYLAGKSAAEKIEILSRTGYEQFLRDYCKVDEQVINIYKRWGTSFWGVGIDEVPTTAIQDYDGGMPGVETTLPRTGYRNDDPYIFHFPDGNASVARLLVRALNPDAVPGSTQEDLVTARIDYARLDERGRDVNIRLSSTVVRAENVKGGVDVTYVRDGATHTVRAKKAVLACYNAAIPYICPQTPTEQRKALEQAIKTPLVYTKVLIPNWRAFAEQGTDFVYYTGGFFKQAEFAYPVSIGDYKCSKSPDDPMVVHMCHTPWVPDIQGPEQWREGRRQLLSTPYETFEKHVLTQLDEALGAAGFDAERDVRAITVNRWPHGYAFNPDLLWETQFDAVTAPWVHGRAPIGDIHIANSDAGAAANTDCAIAQAWRAVNEALA